jgi:hypothetical protein
MLGKNRHTVSSYRASHLCDFSSALAMTISLKIISDMQYTCTVFPLCELSDVSSMNLTSQTTSHTGNSFKGSRLHWQGV